MQICLKNAASFVDAAALKKLESQTEAANTLLENGQGAGNDFIGWVHLPSSITDAFLDEVQASADELRTRCEVVIVAGIGGSYLGARAVNEALSSAFDAFQAKDRKNPYVVYAGNNIGEDYLFDFEPLLSTRGWPAPAFDIAAPAGVSNVDYMLYNVFGGGLFLGAIFMATDYATSPVTKPGQLIFGVGCGLLTCFIRRFGSYPEGVCYSILIMNCTTWLLDKYIRPTIYGAPKKEKKEAAAK